MKNNIKYVILATVIVAVLLISFTALASNTCEGPKELCDQLLSLRQNLEHQRLMTSTDELSIERTMGVSASIALILKVFISVVTANKKEMKTEKGKTAIRLILVLLGAALFIVSNLAFGMKWWESLILALGGPASITIHEVWKLVLVLFGKKKLDDVDKELEAIKNEDSK